MIAGLSVFVVAILRMQSGFATDRAFPVPVYMVMHIPLPHDSYVQAAAVLQHADPGVRTKLKTALRAMQAADTSFTDRVLGASPTPFTGQPVNPDAEIGKRASKRQQTPTPKNDSGGWFDWLF